MDAASGAHLTDSIESGARRRLDGAFRKLRTEKTLDAGERNRLVDEIAQLIETP